ncbi:hypothetical protein Cgig2_029090 [Carnegiea gigantea]|uniref:Uncharacterized protein n=1 Tax=Carnegiea gigantea TaxID=171969 RepID=A0A9Q1QGQ3_9CARY|nr:hypothetical protein Cgig2_029090 [Carnegiea gigantea]
MVMMAAMNSTMPEAKDEHHPHSRRRNWVFPNLRVEFVSQFDEREFEVAEILLNLPYLFTNSVSDFRFSYTWGSKCRRSALDNPPSPPRPRKAVVSSASPLPPPAVNPLPKAEATSPATPLAFCPSDYEVKSKQSTKNKKTSLKRTRDEWRRIIDEKLQTQQTLLKEIEKVKLHMQKLQNENSELKAKHHKLIQSNTGDARREKTQLGDGERLTECPQPERQLQPTVVNDYMHPGPPTSTLLHYHPPSIPQFIINPTVQPQQLHYPQQPGPRGFDLNISAEEMVARERAVPLQPLDHHQIRNSMMSRAYTYAQQARAARRHRIQQNKSKKALRGC